MKANEHKVTHHYQPTANTCGYTSLSILLSHYGIEQNTDDILEKVPMPKNEKGEPSGSVTAQVVAWLLKQGWDVEFYTFDCLFIDLSWQDLSKNELKQKLKKLREKRYVAELGKHWSKIYADAYIDVLDSGGEIKIRPHITSKLLYGLLKNGPVYANFCANTVNNRGRSRVPDISKKASELDDINGYISNHSIVIYGNDSKGNFLVADPWRGMRKIDRETMLCGITAAQIQCDNQCFQLKAK